LGLGRGHDPLPWETPVVATSALTGDGIAELAAAFDAHAKFLKESGEGRRRLKQQHKEEVSLYVSRRVYQDALARLDEHLDALADRETDPASVGLKLLGR
jgi:LAO/AO transport system kinase